ncbi:hypothetical protein BGZ83_008976 [Gryganskiella cystojenkinii]|nr:hypothetical protein BGZ83_008976 [Gryganskiella cystojenkinii]
MKITSFAVLGAVASIASAFVSPSEPIGSTIWKPNTQVTISWTDDGVSPKLTTNPVFDIFFMTGSNDVQIKLSTIATGFKGGANTTINWTVPSVSPPGPYYFLMFTPSNVSQTAWSTRFTITDASGVPPPPPPGATPSANGAIVTASPTSAPTTATTTATTANPTATTTGKNNSAGSLGASAIMTAAAVVGAAALMAL